MYVVGTDKKFAVEFRDAEEGGKEMTLTEALNEQMKDEAFKKEYEALAPEYEIISSLIDARKARNVTQKLLAKTTGIAHSNN